MSQQTKAKQCRPALFIIPGKDTSREEDEPAKVYSYTDVENLPRADEILSVLKERLEEEWGNAQDIVDVYEDDLKIQHETPPTEPYDARGIVVAFSQTGVVPKRLSWNGQFQTAINALQDEYGEEIEIWIDAVSV